MKKGDLVRFEYLMNHRNGVGWELHRGIGILISLDKEKNSYKILTKDGEVVDRLDMQIELVTG